MKDENKKVSLIEKSEDTSGFMVLALEDDSSKSPNNYKKYPSKHQCKIIKSLLSDSVLQYEIEFIIPEGHSDGKFYNKAIISRCKKSGWWDIYSNSIVRSASPHHYDSNVCTSLFGFALGTPRAAIDTKRLKKEFKGYVKSGGYLSERLFKLIFPDNADAIISQMHAMKKSMKMEITAKRSSYRIPPHKDDTSIEIINGSGWFVFKCAPSKDGWILTLKDGIGCTSKVFSDSDVLSEMENSRYATVYTSPVKRGNLLELGLSE